ncbi:TPA: hypothetical protein NGJ40_002799 [Legionella pneumophila]|nr:hypothetical protein [Legionella pneumophila]
MFSLKKTALAVLALGSSAAFAGTMGPVCTPGNVTVPCESIGWDVGVYALYLRPSFSGNTSNFNSLGYTSNGDGSIHHRVLDQDWNWGFKLEGSYHFSTGNDINVNWYHYDHQTDFAPIHYVSLFSGNDLNFFAGYLNEEKWDAVNAEFGQHVDFGVFKDIRFHAGVQYARINHYEYGRYRFTELDGGVPTGVVIEDANNANYKFNGVGPRAGLDMAYNWTNGFAIYGNVAAALLAGDSKIDVPLLEHYSAFKIVPELEAKLGLTYTYGMAQGNLTLDGGYMVTNYFNVVDVPPAGIGGASTNVAYSGPYIGLKYVGAL